MIKAFSYTAAIGAFLSGSTIMAFGDVTGGALTLIAGVGLAMIGMFDYYIDVIKEKK